MRLRQSSVLATVTQSSVHRVTPGDKNELIGEVGRSSAHVTCPTYFFVRYSTFLRFSFQFLTAGTMYKLERTVVYYTRWEHCPRPIDQNPQTVANSRQAVSNLRFVATQFTPECTN